MKFLKIEDPTNIYYCDIETDGLTPTCIWCVVIKCKATKQVWRFINDDSANIYHDLKKFFEERPQAIWIGHNIISFDGIHLSRFCGFTWPFDRTVDTLILSFLYNPALEGGHSLEAYGGRLRYPKVEHTDWSKFTPEMLHRCEVDVDLLELVHDALLERMNKIGFSELSCQIEHSIRKIVDEQQRNGFYFFKDRAIDLFQQLRKRESDLAEPIQKLFPSKLEEVGTYTRRYKKDGSDYASYEKHLGRYDQLRDNGDGTYTTMDWEPFNIGSSQQRLERLLDLGYEPTAKTPKGNPKIDEDSLVAYAKECGRPEVAAMAEWLVCNGRANMVNTWLNYVQPDSRIHGRVFTCGATSRRMTHNSPNCANIPSAQNGAAYGDECRSLWGVTPDLDRLLVGYDAKGLETHVLCHHLAHQKATQLLLEGDVHQLNADSLSLSLGFPVVRGGGGAKTLFYAAIFGSYPKKLGSILKKGEDVGEIVKQTLFKNIPGYKKLLDRVDEEYKANHGLIKTIDGGYVRCPSAHAALNYHIQPDGGILMKMTSILLNQRLKEKGLWHMKVVDVHDEGQHETGKNDAEELGKTAVQCITDAGESLGFRIKMSGSYKVGTNWSQTH